MSDLVCPKCHGAMRTYERSSVTVDQCTECRGIFLDRGELERLVDAENAWAAQGSAPAPAPAPAAPPPPQSAPGYGMPPSYGYDRGPDRGYDRGYDDRYYHKKKRKSFLEELFD